MRLVAKKLVSGLLLTLYGSISVLGYGLHDLVPEDTHHHRSLACGSAGPLAIKAATEDDDHDCDICVFLDQALSVQPQIQSVIVWQHLIAVIEVVVPRLTCQTTELSRAPRGPPVLIG